MVLGSQSGRRNAGGVYKGGHYRKSRRPRRTAGIAAVIVLAVGYLGWSMVGGDGEPAPPEAGSGSPEGGTQVAATGGTSTSEGPAESGTGSTRADARAEAPAADGTDGSGDTAEPEPFDSLTQDLEDDNGAGMDSDRSADAGSGAGDAGDGAASNDPTEELSETALADAGSLEDETTADPQDGGEDTSSGSAGLQSDPAVARLIREGRKLIDNGQPIRGRRMLSDALRAQIAPADARAVRRELTELNEGLIFSPEAHPDDPLTDTYVVQSGDLLGAIADRFNIPHQLIAHINELEDPNRLQVGWRLKVINGPFDVIVHKEAFRLDVYLDEVYIRSFDVGLGEHNSTPLGRFVVKTGSKLSNPEWTNPRTGERVLADDPENPLGEYWIGLRGTDEETEKLGGYGIHGTIEPETIGTEASMGCVRLAPDDIELLYAMLNPGQSRVTIRE